MERSKVQIQFKEIFYEAEVIIGSAGLPSVGNSFKNLLQVTATHVNVTNALNMRSPCRSSMISA